MTVQLDYTPISSMDSLVIEEELVHRLSNQAQQSLTPWIGYRFNDWIVLSSIQYDIWEYRSWSETDQALQNLGQIEMQLQLHRIFEREELLLTAGAGLIRNVAISNRNATIFTEEEQLDYDEQSAALKDEIETLGSSALFSIQYPLPNQLFLGLGYDAYALFQQKDRNGLLEISMNFYSEPKIFLRAEF